MGLRPRDTVDFSKLMDPQSKKWKTVVPSVSLLGPAPPVAECEKCKGPATECCPKCLDTPYCSSKCLQQDFSKHAPKCGEQLGYTLVHDENNGSPYYIFTKNLIQGNPLWIEESIVILPVLPEEYKKDDVNQTWEWDRETMKMVCFGCNKHYFPGEKLEFCKSCGIFLCSPNCGNDNEHQRHECQVLSRFSGRNFLNYITSKRKYVELYLDICVLRILEVFSRGLQIASVAEKWKLFTLLAQTDRFKTFTKTKADLYDGVQYMKFMNKSVDVLQFSLAFAKYDREIVQQVYKTMIAFWEEKYDMSTGQLSRHLYLNRHFLTQNCCTPHIAVSYTYKQRKSQPLCVFYVNHNQITISDNHKKNHLRITFDFTSPRYFMPAPLKIHFLNEIGRSCSNPKCFTLNDLADGGFNTANIRCLKCYDSLYTEYSIRGEDLLLSNKPFPKRWSPEYIETMDWKCESCGDVQPFSVIFNVNKELDEYYRIELVRRPAFCPISGISAFINFYENCYLHPTHGIILQAKYDYLMATREKHYWQCGFTRMGFVNDRFLREKMNLDIKHNPQLHMLPTKWNRDEFLLTQDRLRFSQECFKYMGRQRLSDILSCRILHRSEHTFLNFEAVSMGLLMACYRLLSDKEDKSVADDFVKSAICLRDTYLGWMFSRVMYLHPTVIDFDPLLRVSEEMKVYAEMLKYQPAFILPRLMMKSMKVTVEQFLSV